MFTRSIRVWPGLAAHAGGDDHDVAAGGGFVITGIYVHGLAEQRGALMNIHGLAQRTILIDIDDDDFVGDVAHCQRKRGGGSDAAGTDDGNLLGHDSFPAFL